MIFLAKSFGSFSVPTNILYLEGDLELKNFQGALWTFKIFLNKIK